MREGLLDRLDREIKKDKFYGMVVGTLIGIKKSGELIINFATNGSIITLSARSTVRLDDKDIGREVTVMFENGDCQKPVMTGLIQKPEVGKNPNNGQPKKMPIQFDMDGDSLQLTAQKEIVLRCGKGSITITRAGKIILRGTYLLNRSSGVNRIKGGSVQIN